MPILLGLIAAILGWAVWTKRIALRQLPPAIVIIAGAAIAAKGQFLGGIGLLVVGLAWFAGARRPKRASLRNEGPHDIERARNLLGVSADDDAEIIRMRHRRLITENHPDAGGSDERAAQLNDARDLLLAALDKPKN